MGLAGRATNPVDKQIYTVSTIERNKKAKLPGSSDMSLIVFESAIYQGHPSSTFEVMFSPPVVSIEWLWVWNKSEMQALHDAALDLVRSDKFVSAGLKDLEDLMHEKGFSAYAGKSRQAAYFFKPLTFLMVLRRTQ